MSSVIETPPAGRRFFCQRRGQVDNSIRWVHTDAAYLMRGRCRQIIALRPLRHLKRLFVCLSPSAESPILICKIFLFAQNYL